MCIGVVVINQFIVVCGEGFYQFWVMIVECGVDEYVGWQVQLFEQFQVVLGVDMVVVFMLGIVENVGFWIDWFQFGI